MFIYGLTATQATSKVLAILESIEYLQQDYNDVVLSELNDDATLDEKTQAVKAHLTKLMNMVMENPVWDAGFRISRYDKMLQGYVSCPLKERYKNLFGIFDIKFSEHVCSKYCHDSNPHTPRQFLEFTNDDNITTRHTMHVLSHRCINTYVHALYKDHWSREVGHESLYKIGSIQYHRSIDHEKEVKGKNKDNYVRELRSYTREEKEISNARRVVKQMDRGRDERTSRSSTSNSKTF